jgi:hypothetical protein
MLIDAHCHIMPDRLAHAIRRFYRDFMNEGALAYPGVVLPDVVQAQRDAKTDGFWALPYAHKAGIAASLNAWMATHVQPLPGAVAAATFHPDDDDLAALARHAFDDLGLRAAKLHCSVGRFDADDPRLEPVWNAAEVRSLPIVIHAGHDMNGRTQAHELAPLGRVAARHPWLHLVIAHCALPHVDAALDLLERFPALYADLTSVGQWDYPIPVARLERLHERLLFGSDCPNTTITITEAAEYIRRLGLSDHARRAVMGENARRLTGPTV